MSALDNIDVFPLVNRHELSGALERANDISALQKLLAGVATMQELARRIGLALEEQNRIAEYRILASYKLGKLLATTVRRGGRGSNSPGMSSNRGGSSAPLPEGLSWNQSSKFQRLALIPEEKVRRYIETACHRGKSISVADLLRSYHPRRPAERSSGPGSSKEDRFWEALCDAVRRVMDVDVAVGVPAHLLGASQEIQPADALQEPLHGKVFVSTDTQMARWLEKLVLERLEGAVSGAMLLMPAAVGEPWFGLVQEGKWICCFFRNDLGASRSVAIVYHGEQRHGFYLVFREMGVVLEPAQY